MKKLCIERTDFPPKSTSLFPWVECKKSLLIHAAYQLKEHEVLTIASFGCLGLVSCSCQQIFWNMFFPAWFLPLLVAVIFVYYIRSPLFSYKTEDVWPFSVWPFEDLVITVTLLVSKTPSEPPGSPDLREPRGEIYDIKMQNDVMNQCFCYSYT